MKGVTPQEKAALLVAECAFKIRRDFPLLSVGECCGLLIRPALLEACRLEGTPVPRQSAELAYRIGDELVALVASDRQSGETA